MGYIISVLTNKGGTGKTTTTISLGYALAKEGKKILIIDNDSQCNATSILENDFLEQNEIKYTLNNIYGGDIEDIKSSLYLIKSQSNLYCIPNIPETSAIEPVLIRKGVESGFIVLRNFIREYAAQNFDITIIDNAPNHGIFVINSLYASDFAIVPVDTGSKASIRGLVKAIEFIDEIKADGNKDLRFLKLLATKADRRTYVSKVLLSQLKEYFGEKMFNTVIPINAAIQQAELKDESIYKHNPKSLGAKCYKDLAKELLTILQ